MQSNIRYVFIKTLSHLLNSGLSMGRALLVMEKMNSLSSSVKNACFEIRKYLENGSLMSMALKKCCNIYFPEIYGAFVSCSERGAGVCEVFDFLYKMEDNFRNRKKRIILSSIYPSFVTFAAFAGCIFLVHFCKNIVTDLSGNFDFESYEKNAMYGCIVANSFLIFAIGFTLILYKRISLNEEFFDSFKIINFLLNAGIDLYSSLKISLLAVKDNNRLKEKILSAIRELEQGKRSSFACRNFGSECVFQLELSEESGMEKNAFANICKNYETKIETQQKLFFEMFEPVSMAVIALYIMILLKTVVMPAFFNYGI